MIMLSQLINKLQRLLGIEQAPVSHVERLVSAAGGFIAILAILLISHKFLDGQALPLIVASMGASAVLLFAVPHGPLSQPWPLVGGHLVSALVGVSCVELVGNPLLAAALAVGLAIGAMHYLRCIHPPGGATALTAALGGGDMQALGYQFVITPVLLNVLVILLVAVLFNLPFAWRRYPVGWKAHRDTSQAGYESISHGDLVYALSEIDSFVDISERDLLRIYSLATRRHVGEPLALEQIGLGRYYSNAARGDDWSVRQVIDQSSRDAGSRDEVIYKIVDGHGVYATGHMSRAEFARWARQELRRDGDGWQLVDAGSVDQVPD